MSQADPRLRLSTSGAPPAPGKTAFSSAVYARFYDMKPQIQTDRERTWLARGQNFIIAFSEVKTGARLERNGQPDEYVLILPDEGVSATVSAGAETQKLPGFSIAFIPSGDSAVEVQNDGRIIRLFSAQSRDLAAQTANEKDYHEQHPHIPPFEPWPEPKGGFKIRSYSLDVADEPGRFGKIWRCTTFMVNVFPPQHGPRDPAKLSPHHHDDFEQCSLVIGGEYVHHLRWPWTANLAEWREDQHELCGTPSVCVIPPKAIHTSAAVDPDVNLLIDIFSPPRRDFSEVEGWVLNADEYPMPPKDKA